MKIKDFCVSFSQKLLSVRVIAWFWEVLKGFLKNNCSMHAAGLTYFAMLAIVPVLCVLLFTAKMCGADDYARKEVNFHLDAMISNIENGQDEEIVKWFSDAKVVSEEERAKKREAALEFGTQARKISNLLFDRIERFDIGTLGWIGFAFLLWTVISSIGMVEVSFNEIFEVPKPRPVWKRALLYLAITTILPILVAIAMSLPILNIVKDILVATLGATWLTKWVSDGVIWFLDSAFLRFAFVLLMASLTFGFVFWIMPNCKVSKLHAWWGGFITAVFFGAWMKICAIAQVGIAKSSALYGSFAILPIVLAWFYMSWQIILLGAVMVRSFETSRRAK